MGKHKDLQVRILWFFVAEKRLQRPFMGLLQLFCCDRLCGSFPLILSLILARCSGSGGKVSVLTVETPQKLSASQTDTFTLDVTVSELGDALYPAMSMSLRFNPSCLEFLGIEEGNVFVTNSQVGRKLPQWSCNPEQCNKTGRINIMYLDLTGGKEAFTQSLLA